MKARISKIDETVMSRNKDVSFQRIHFVLEDGSFAMTDVVSTYRNYQYWKPVIESGVGTYINGVDLKYKGKVDADSIVYIFQRPVKIEQDKLEL